MRKKLVRRSIVSAVCAGALVAGVLSYVSASQAQSTEPGPLDPALVEKGIQIAPVPLNLDGKDRNKVGYGSYLVNAIGGCNDCHTNPSYTEDGDPYMGKPTQINAAAYLSGGTAFGPFLSRNITPDATGEVVGGRSNFIQILRTGLDLVDHLHPQISPLLQVMPWPLYTNLADRDLDAIYEYLTAIPCVEGGGPNAQPNRCVPAPQTQAVALPKNGSVINRQIELDGTQSSSADGKALKFFWTIPPGYPVAAVLRGTTSTPSVQFGTAKGVYAFDLTVTDSTGATSTDRATVTFLGR